MLKWEKIEECQNEVLSGFFFVRMLRILQLRSFIVYRAINNHCEFFKFKIEYK